MKPENITVWDWYAGQALAGILARAVQDRDYMVRECARIADEMMKLRPKPANTKGMQFTLGDRYVHKETRDTYKLWSMGPASLDGFPIEFKPLVNDLPVLKFCTLKDSLEVLEKVLKQEGA